MVEVREVYEPENCPSCDYDSVGWLLNFSPGGAIGVCEECGLMVVQVGANHSDETKYYWYEPVYATKREPDEEDDNDDQD